MGSDFSTPFPKRAELLCRWPKSCVGVQLSFQIVLFVCAIVHRFCCEPDSGRATTGIRASTNLNFKRNSLARCALGMTGTRIFQTLKLRGGASAETDFQSAPPSMECKDALTAVDGLHAPSTADSSKSDGTVWIRKPDIDKRSYRYLKLENGLQAVVISDPETHSGAAALCVGVGQLDDPPEVQGLAHFCEHMLFLGTEKYPDESNFDQFCGSCAGYSNAWTSTDHTLYHFIVAHNKLQEALDRFSSFFSCPLFSEGGTDREMHAVDSENNKNLQDDERREHQLMRSMSAPDHPMSRFGAGSYKTLHDLPAAAGINVREELLKFHKMYYSAHSMRLSVIGRETLEELEGYVRSLFSSIRKNDQASPRKWVETSPFGEQWRRQVLVVPVKERRKLSLSFPSPALHPEFRTKPLYFLSQVIGHEGPGSLLACIRDLGWATELSAGPGTQLPNESLFGIGITLTEEGVKNWGEIVKIVFFFLKMLRRSDMPTRERIRGEASKIHELNFRFRSKEREDAYTENVAYALHFYPPQDVLCATELYFDAFDQRLNDRIDELLTHNLCPSNMRLQLVCPEEEIPASFLSSVAEQDSKRSNDETGAAEAHSAETLGGEWKTESWYGIRYFDKPLDAVLVRHCSAELEEDECSTYPPVQAMHLPPPNRYIPEKCDVLAPPAGGHDKVPTKIVEEDAIVVWHLLDVSFEQPKAMVCLQLNSPIVDTSARHAALLRMLLEVLELSVNKERYMAEEGGLSIDITNYSFSSPCLGLRIQLFGYSSKLPLLLADMLAALAGLAVGEEAFAMAKEKTVTDYRNRRFQQPYCHALIAGHAVLESPFWSNEERCAEVERLTPADLAAFHRDFLASLSVEALVAGNLDAAGAAAAAAAVRPLARAPRAARVPLRIARLADGATYRHAQLGPDPDHGDSAVVVYLQAGPQTHALDAALELLVQIMDRDAYAQLRTREQLGYIVSAEAHARWGVAGVRVSVQSARPPAEVEARVDAFLAAFRARLAGMPAEELAEHAASLVTKKLEPDRTLEAAGGRAFHEVVSHTLVFDRRRREAEALGAVRREDLVALYDGCLACRLAAHVVGRAALEACAGAVGPESAAKLAVARPGSAEEVMALSDFAQSVEWYSVQP